MKYIFKNTANSKTNLNLFPYSISTHPKHSGVYCGLYVLCESSLLTSVVKIQSNTKLHEVENDCCLCQNCQLSISCQRQKSSFACLIGVLQYWFSNYLLFKVLFLKQQQIRAYFADYKQSNLNLNTNASVSIDPTFMSVC